MEDNKNFITYDKDWQNVSTPEYPDVSEPESEFTEFKDKIPKPSKKLNRGVSKQRLLTLQLLICLLIGITAFVLKSIGGDWYSLAREWYYTNLNNTAVFDSNGGFDVNLLLGRSTADEAEDI